MWISGEEVISMVQLVVCDDFKRTLNLGGWELAEELNQEKTFQVEETV